MITVQNRPYDLPESLLFCPACRRADLVWDGRSAWRCSYVKVTASGQRKPGCKHGITLRGLFEDDELEYRFGTSQVELTTLRLTAYGRELVRAGVLTGVFCRIYVQQMREVAADADARDAAMREVDRLMRKAPGPTASIRARRIRSLAPPEKGEEL